MLSHEWHDCTNFLSLVDIFFQNLSLPLIGWQSCQLSVSIPALPPAPRPLHWTCSVATCVVWSSGTNFPSHFVPEIKSVRTLRIYIGSKTNRVRVKWGKGVDIYTLICWSLALDLCPSWQWVSGEYDQDPAWHSVSTWPVSYVTSVLREA